MLLSRIGRALNLLKQKGHDANGLLQLRGVTRFEKAASESVKAPFFKELVLNPNMPCASADSNVTGGVSVYDLGKLLARRRSLAKNPTVYRSRLDDRGRRCCISGGDRFHRETT
jgi:hypothetical protein